MQVSRAFTVTEPVELDVRNPSGDVDITAADTSEATVLVESTRSDAERCTIELRGNRLNVHAPENRGFGFLSVRGHGYDMRITVPRGSSVRTSCASADVRVTGRVDSFEAVTASGDIRAEEIDGTASVKAASGDVDLGSVTGPVKITSASGDVSVHSAERVEVTTASGDVEVTELGDSAWAKTASGEITIRRAGQGTVDVATASGEVWVGVATGTDAKLTLRSVSGRVTTGLPVEDEAPEAGATLDIQARTVSGGITVARAPAAQPNSSRT